MTWTEWRAHFEKNAHRELPPFGSGEGVPERHRDVIVDSLAKFQLGEAGEGRIAKQIDRCHWATIDDDYRASLKRFVAEEGRHARILGGLIRALDGETIKENWTEKLFVFGRRLVGVKLKLMVLLAAEVIGVTFYRAIAERLEDGATKRALFEICEDERKHLAFHLDFFQRERHLGLWRALWFIIGRAAAASVMLDHRQTIRALELDVGARFTREIDNVACQLRPNFFRSRRAAARETVTPSPQRVRAM